jgi:hypothetical protein
MIHLRIFNLALLATLSFSSIAQEHSREKITIGEQKNSIVYKRKNSETICLISVPIRELTLTGDGKALIIDINSYLLIDDLKKCSFESPKVYSTPKEAGALKDLNVNSKIYLALDFINVAPFRYLATVSKLGSTKNLIRLPGVNLSGQPLATLQQSGFLEIKQPRISPDGRFVSADGRIDCSLNRFPGIWDLKTKKRIYLDDLACKDLFSKGRADLVEIAPRQEFDTALPKNVYIK